MTTDIGAAVTAGTYAIDTDRSRIRFTATHAFGLGPVTGACAVRDGTITIDSDPAGCAAGVRVGAASIATGNVRRDQAVSSKRFLDVREYPDMLFISGRLGRDGDRWVLDGTLTVRGVTAPVTLGLSSADAEAGGCRFRACAHRPVCARRGSARRPRPVPRGRVRRRRAHGEHGRQLTGRRSPWLSWPAVSVALVQGAGRVRQDAEQ